MAAAGVPLPEGEAGLMANTDDLRYVRTEEAIRAAFMELVSEQPVGSVTASDVCRRAGISRNGFYLHHAGVQGLYFVLVGELVDGVRAQSVASAERRATTGRDDAFSASIWEALARHENLLRALLPSDDGSLVTCLAEGIEAAFVEAALRFGEHGGSLEHRLRCAYAAWAVVGMARRWVASTDRPLGEALPHFERLAAGVNEQSSSYLVAGMAQ